MIVCCAICTFALPLEEQSYGVADDVATGATLFPRRRMGTRHPSISWMKFWAPEMIGTWASEYGVPKSKGTDIP